MIPPRSALPGVHEDASMGNVQHLRLALASHPSGISHQHIEIDSLITDCKSTVERNHQLSYWIEIKSLITDCKFSVERDARSQAALVEGMNCEKLRKQIKAAILAISLFRCRKHIECCMIYPIHNLSLNFDVLISLYLQWRWGVGCKEDCSCKHGGTCHGVTGECRWVLWLFCL